MILLDTDVCVAILRGYSNAVASYSRNRGNVAISAMTVGGNVRHFSRFQDLELFDWLHL